MSLQRSSHFPDGAEGSRTLTSTMAKILLLGLVLAGLPIVWRTAKGLFRGHFATDVVASMAIVGAVLLQQPLAGLIVVIMQTGGEALERYAEGRASAALRQLEADAPQLAHRVGAAGDVTDVHADEVLPGDTLLIRPGEMVPADCEVLGGDSHVDASRITGEPLPVATVVGAKLMSGSLNSEGALTVRATARAAESQYARIVELVRGAQATKAPLQRLADRYAVWFTPLTILTCAAAYFMTHETIRVLAILVVATPCPLILAAPVAIVGGINRAARHQIIVRNGSALEALARANVAVFDKTGTITVGAPRVVRIECAGGFSETELLRLAGSIEQGSSHLVGRALTEEAGERHITLTPAFHSTETPGRGVTGLVDGRTVTIGGRSYVDGIHGAAATRFGADAARSVGLRAWIAVDGAPAGWMEFDDRARPGLKAILASLAALGLTRTILLSGDNDAHTQAVARDAGIREAFGDLLPEDKVRRVRELGDAGERVLFIGDGTNDAPALSAASVGIALAAHGGGIAAEAADAVILNDDLGRVVDAVRISRRTVAIAKQSIRVGLLLSGVAMGFAAAGYLAPIPGALLQEAIDIAVILNAVRASADARTAFPIKE